VKKSWALVAFCGALLAYPGPKSMTSVRGSISNFSGQTILCGSGGTLYRNLTSGRIDFDLEVALDLRYFSSPSACSSTILSWTDAQGRPQTRTVNKGFTTIVATSLPAGGAITWSTAYETAPVAFRWILQRQHAESLDSPAGEFGECGTSGSLYTNLTNHAVELDIAVDGPKTCEATLSWTDTNGQDQTLKVDLPTTEGVSTSLPAGGIISWTTSDGKANDGFSSYFDRVPSTSPNQNAKSPH
jgi:hypothetical protein